MSQSPQYEEVRYRDSGKVLSVIADLMGDLKGVLATHREAGGTDGSPAGNQARENTLDFISEALNDAKKQTKIHVAGSPKADAMDPRQGGR